MEELNLSDRLRLIAGLIKKGSKVADIGTDHGYLPIFLVKSGITDRVIAMDVRKGPLKKAEDNTRAFCVFDQIELRLSDGLAALEKGEADTVTISGMGGRLIQSILTNGMEKLDKSTRLIVSLEAVQTMAKIALRTEEALDYAAIFKGKGISCFRRTYDDRRWSVLCHYGMCIHGCGLCTADDRGSKASVRRIAFA